jgi:predicted extracellular nuclease
MKKHNVQIARLIAGLMVLTLVLGLIPIGGTRAYAASPGDVVINEIIQNPAAVADSAGEWFELFNPTSADIDINGWTIADNDIDSHVIDNGGPLIIPAGGYLVLGNNTDTETNGGAPVAYSYGSSWFLANGADEVILTDAIGIEIDRVEYDGGPIFPDPTGASMALIDPALDNNVGANWCTASTPFGAGDLGTPGAENDCPVATVELVINEIIQNPAAVADADGEWFELYNPTDADIDIDGWTIQDNDFDSHVINGTLVIPAGGYVVLGINADINTNGGAAVDYQYENFFLGNSADEVVLLDAALNEIDRVEYDDGATFPDPNGASMALVNPALDNNVGANWCTASTPYGDGDQGTPGAANDCVVPVAEIVINEIMQNPAAVFDSNGEWFEIYNPTTSGIDINGWTIADNDIDSHVIDNGGPLTIPAGGYLVLGNNDNSSTNGGLTVDYVFSGIALANGGDELVLRDGALNEIDRVEWDDGATFPDPNGASMALVNPALDNNFGANWCTASTPYGDGDLGTPGAANDCPPPEIVINEIMQNPAAVSDSNGEWFELYNPTSGDVDINGWTIQDNDTDSHVIDNVGSLVIPAGGYLVLGNNGNSASNGGVNVDYVFSSIFLGNSSDELVLLDGALSEIDRVEWDGGTTFPDPTGASMVLAGPALDNNVGANWCTASTPYGDGDLGTPGGVNDCNECGDPFTHVYEVQGGEPVSPFDGWLVSVEGVVTGDFQGPDELRGFFIQDLAGDGETSTSDGVFVYAPGSIDVSVGDAVRLTGEVDEYFGLTEITSVAALLHCGMGSIASTDVELPIADIGEWEQYEGMLITIPQTLYATDNYNQGRYGEVTLSVNGRLDNPTNVVEPGAPAVALQDLNDRSQIQLDDGSAVENPLPLPPYLGVDNTMRAGDTIPSLTGVLGYAFGVYEIHPTGPVDFARVNTRPEVPAVGGSIKVAGFNVLNYFATIDTGAEICGPASDQECRGADTQDEFERQRAKIIAAITDLDADIVGLIELENHPDDTPIADLVGGLNAIVGAGTYEYIATGAIGTDAIRVGLIYQPSSVTPVGDFAVLDSSVDSRFIDTLNRPVLAQTFQENGTDDLVSVAVNHLKSKGTPCDDVGDPDIGDGQGNCNLTRTAAAAALADWLATDPTGSGSADSLIIGDLNAYAKEDPIDAIVGAGYVNLVEAFEGASAYSYVFFGQAGYLDHALSSPDLASRVTDTGVWHINADEPSALDYNNYNQPALYSADPFRASDHDPVVVGICETTPPVVEVTASPDMLWPPNHKYKDVTATVTVVDADPNPAVALVSVTSNEPDNGEDDGNTVDDIVIVDDFNFQLRAERSGIGTGRVYTIEYEVTDACGNTTLATATVTVPLSFGE